MRKISLILVALLLGACSGGGGSSPATGTLSVAITDASINDYQEALLRVGSITLIGSGGQETEVLETPQTVDLLKLRNVSELLLRTELTARTISKIRLGVESITLVKRDQVTGDYIGEDNPPVPTGKIDLNFKPVEIRAGEDIIVTIDVDLHNSVKITDAGSTEVVRFRPLVKVTTEPSGLVRLYGTYTDDGTDSSICDLQRVSDADGTYETITACIPLDETNAHYFDVDGLPIVDGDPASSGDLADGEKVSAYGYYQLTDGDDVLAVELIARGTGTRGEAFTTLNGIALTDWDSTTRRFDLALTDVTSLPVELSDGAKVFDPDGDIVPPESIQMDHRVEARGALTDSGTTDPDWLQSFFAVVGEEGSIDSTSGVIDVIDGSLIMLTGASGAACVVTTADTEFYSIEMGGEITDTSPISLLDLLDGQTIDASGDQVGDCIQADTVIYEVTP